MNRITSLFSRSLSAMALVALILTTIGFDSGAAATRLRPRAKAAAQEKVAVPQEVDAAADKGEPETRERPKGSPPEGELHEMPLGLYDDGPSVQAPGVITPSQKLQTPGQTLPGEVEPNGTPATATPIVGTSARIRGYIFLAGDIDVYSFTAAANDRVYAATMTSLSSNASVDSVLELISTDGVTVLETDLDDGT